MKLKKLLLAIIFSFLLFGPVLSQNIEVHTCNEPSVINDPCSKAEELDEVLKELTEKGIPGVARPWQSIQTRAGG